MPRVKYSLHNRLLNRLDAINSQLDLMRTSRNKADKIAAKAVENLPMEAHFALQTLYTKSNIYTNDYLYALFGYAMTRSSEREYRKTTRSVITALCSAFVIPSFVKRNMLIGITRKRPPHVVDSDIRAQGMGWLRTQKKYLSMDEVARKRVVAMIIDGKAAGYGKETEEEVALAKKANAAGKLLSKLPVEASYEYLTTNRIKRGVMEHPLVMRFENSIEEDAEMHKVRILLKCLYDIPIKDDLALVDFIKSLDMGVKSEEELEQLRFLSFDDSAAEAAMEARKKMAAKKDDQMAPEDIHFDGSTAFEPEQEVDISELRRNYDDNREIVTSRNLTGHEEGHFE